MKLVSFSKVLLVGALALLMFAGSASAFASRGGEQPQSKYPNATRKAPSDMQGGSERESEKLKEAAAAITGNDAAKAKEILQPLADGTQTKNKYVQSMAEQYLMVLANNTGDLKGAIEHLNKALSIGYLPNDTYFDLQFSLAKLYINDKQFQKSLDTIQDWRKNGKLETAESYGFEGLDYYNLGEYDKAITAIKKAKSMSDKSDPMWDQVLAASYAETGNADQAVAAAKAQLAKHPDDMVTLNNTVNVLISAGEYDEARDLLDKAYAKGQLTSETQYIQLANLHMAKAQGDEHPKAETDHALAILKQGEDKGIVKPGYETYRIQANAYYLNDKIAAAIAEFEKAAKTAPDGEMDLQAAKLLGSQHKYSASLSHAHTALKRGLKHPGQAYLIIGRAQQAMHNATAAKQAMHKAEQDPTTKAQARAWLKKAAQSNR